MMSNGAVSWLSKRQAVVALSTAEAEYIALSTATPEVIWLRKLLKDLGQPPEGPTTLYEDNQGAIAIAQNPVAHSRTKHIDIRYHFIREGIESGLMDLEFCPSVFMKADIPIKPLLRARFGVLTMALGLTCRSNKQ
ncbi:MAG: Ty1/Copia family ribonuclease HI [Gammaproteobacteria bacterium]|nr:Ty1/Copia family ribonuclease HI [Gammaproteobacteria bacterium]